MKAGILSAVVMSAFVGFAPAAETPDASKWSQAISTAVTKGHPRLFATKADFAALKGDLSKGALRSLAAQRVRERAQRLLSTKPLERKMIGRRLLHTSREALCRISTLALAYRLSSDRRFLDRAVAELSAVCAFPDWNPSHFLDTGEMSLAVAIGYDWLHDDLSEGQRAAIRSGLAKNGLRTGLRGGGWARARNNWGQVCRAGMIAAALALADDGELAPDCAKMLGESVEALPISMKAMAPDGCYPEGAGYWHYGVSFNVFAIAMLESACGTDFGLSALPGFLQTADYPNGVTGPTGLTVGYSDCGSNRPSLPVLWWFARRLGRPDLITRKEIAEWDTPPAEHFAGWQPPVELFWMDDRDHETVAAKRPLVYAPRGSVPIAVLRSGWGDDDAFVGLKGGSPNSPHGHMDGGNFVLDMAGVRWAWELPHENYNRIEQMKTVSLWSMKQDSGRWSLLRLNTFGHNVPSVDGAQQRVDGRAEFLSVSASPAPNAVMDLSGLYPAAKKVTRTCRLAEGGKSVTVVDEFAGLRPGAAVRWQFVLRASHAVNADKLLLTEGKHVMEVLRQPAAASEWKVEPAEGEKPLNSPNPGAYVAFFTLKAGADGQARAEVAFSLVK